MAPLAFFFAVAALLGLVATRAALRRRRRVSGALSLMASLLMLSLAALLTTLSVSVRGYRALTNEELAAVVVVVPRPDHRFTARFTFPDSSVRVFNLSGDQLYVDARILKWKPIANLLGVHTSYELDRVGGRYTRLADEQNRPHSVFALTEHKSLDLFRLRRRFQRLNPLVDAEYGSATFASAESFGEFRVLVSTTGLLIRKSDAMPDR